MAVSSFPETPMKGHSPRNCTSTKLFTRMVLTSISKYSVIGVSQPCCLHYPHAGRGAGIRRQDENLLATRTCGQNHTFRHAELHFPGFEVGHHHGHTAFQVFRFVGGLDTSKHVAFAMAYIKCQAKKLVCAFHMLGFDDLNDP